MLRKKHVILCTCTPQENPCYREIIPILKGEMSFATETSQSHRAVIGVFAPQCEPAYICGSRSELLSCLAPGRSRMSLCPGRKHVDIRPHAPRRLLRLRHPTRLVESRRRWRPTRAAARDRPYSGVVSRRKPIGAWRTDEPSHVFQMWYCHEPEP
jgi:hypothetical protein